MNVLLVDDSKTMRMIQKKALSAIPGLNLFEAGDGVEALSVIAASPVKFEIGIIDWNMPNMNGLELIKKIRETDKKMMLIMATTEAEKESVMEAIKAGVNNYVVKPFTAESLLEKFKATMAKIAA